MQTEVKETLEKRLVSIEISRKKLLRKFKLKKRLHRILKWIYTPFVLVFALAVTFPIIFPFVIPAIVIAVVLVVIDSFILDLIFKNPEVKFRDDFKKDIVEWLIGSSNETFKYQSEGKIEKQKIQDAQLFIDNIDDYKGEDYVKGTIAGVTIEVCEGQLSVNKITFKKIAKEFASAVADVAGQIIISLLGGESGYDEGDDDTNKNLVLFFNGLLMQAEFNKKHVGSIHVVPANTSKSWFIRKDLFLGKRRVEMDNAEFNKSFSTYTTGELEAHYVLSPKLMQSLLEIEAEVKGGIFLSFRSGKLFMGINWKKDFFEANLNKPITSINDIEQIISQINFFESLVKKLSLDVKIWTQEVAANEK